MLYNGGMPHLRTRHVLANIKKLASLWPLVGVLGPRQSGKTTLLSKLLGVENMISLDEALLREEAQRSPDLFLSRLSTPVVIDEVQKAPQLFDSLKLKVDKKRVPGLYYLTGSSNFSLRIGIRESLTGRLGAVSLTPMTLAELNQKPFFTIKDLANPTQSQKAPRFDLSLVTKSVVSGGMPVPAFLHASEQRHLYWSSWLDTTLHRDLPRQFARGGYDPDLALNLINRLATVFGEGELPSLKHFAQNARKVRRYFSAMEDIFLLRKISCHPLGTGREVWLFFDSGLLAYLLGNTAGEANFLSLVRHFLWNEWLSHTPGLPFEKLYYKSTQGQPVDAVLNNIPFRIVGTTTGLGKQFSWETRPLMGAMKKLGSKIGYLVGPTEIVTAPQKNNGVGILPWGMWS